MRKFFRRLAALWHRRRLEQQLEEEMAAHREMMPPGRRPNFGSTLLFHEQAADHWGWTWLDHLRQDLAYAVRQLRRSPGFTLTAIAVLSLGIGVNLAEAHIFTALLHRLNVRDVDSLCQFFRITRQRTTSAFSLPKIAFYRRNNTVLSAVITENDVDGVYLAQDATALRCALVSGNFFGELGIAPLYGRLLDEQDDRPGSTAVAVLGYDYWQSRFGGDPGVVGRVIRLNDKPVEVVGVAPSPFGGLVWHASAWMAATQYPYLTGHEPLAADYQTHSTYLFGRLKQGISLSAAQAQLGALTAELRRQQPEYMDPAERLDLQPAEGRSLSSPSLLLLLSTCILLVLLVLFSACANLGNMLLARGLARRREIEIRLALGAGWWRLVRQLMTENLLLAVLASMAALFVGRLAALLLLRITSAPSSMRVVTDWRIVLASAALGLGATLAFGLAPAVQIVKGGAEATRARKILVSVQVAASCVLLILSAYFTRAIQHNFRTEAGFDYSRLALVDPAFYLHHYAASDARQTASEIAARLRRLPGIEGASIMTTPPVRASRIQAASGQRLYVNEVDPSYFPMMHLPALLGHIFGPGEPDAVVIAQSAARQLWPNQSPLGRTLRIAQRDRTVTGVVEDSGVNVLRDAESVEVYLPVSDRGAPFATILVRAANSPAPMTGTLRSAATLSGNVPLVFTLQGLVDQQLESVRKMIRVLVSLAAIASLLALIGIFGLLAFTVAQRTREIGVRMALGAGGVDILRVVLGQYAVPFGAGAAAGVAVAAAAATVMRHTVYGFLSFDVLGFGAGLLLFAAVALAAAIAPARRALRVDPSSALRYE